VPDLLRPARAAGPALVRAIRVRPAALVVLAFAAAVLVGTALLAAPWANEEPEATPLLVAFFTAVSSVCVTGLTVVDTPTYWSTAGELTILGLIQLGGLGFMTLASILGLLVFRRLGLRSRMTAATETKTLDVGDLRRLLLSVLGFSAAFETVAAAILTLRLWTTYDEPLGRAAYLGVFHAISAFNNAGFALYSDNLIGFVTDAVFVLTVSAAVIAGGIGFPVLRELRHELLTPRTWTLHTRLTVWTSLVLLLVGTALFAAFEWTNDATLGRLGVGDKLLVGFFGSVVARTAGFNSIDYGDATPSTLLLNDALMFIGGGPAGTAGGIKVTTFVLLAYVILAEVRGDDGVNAGNRRIPAAAQRQALTVALLGVGLVMTTTLTLLSITGLDLDVVLFEVISAFATVGLSTGITADLPPSGQVLLAVLMFAGRLGPITLASALALRARPTLYRLPEERPVVG
jgi:trk system potassium uptake protein TrkH